VKKLGVLIAVALVGGVLAALAVSAGAVSPSEEACGGTFTRIQGEAICMTSTSDPAGNSENGHDFGSEETTTGQGNYTPKPGDTTTTCTGAGSSGNCPAGQQ
jgi:hypothetical protein